jgi:hypothetical protein
MYFLQFEASIDQKDTLVMRNALPNNKLGIRFFNLIVSFMYSSHADTNWYLFREV